MDDTSSTNNLITLEKIKKYYLNANVRLKASAKKVSAEGIGWLGVMFLHCATVPSILSLIFGISDGLPSLDIVLLIWVGLFLFFIKALINRDMLNIITHGIGFFVQVVLLGVVIFQ